MGKDGPMHERLTRESDDDPCFPQPIEHEWDMPLWRYMDLWKFESLFAEGLYFSRLDCLGDAWEGSMPAGTAADLKMIASIPEIKPFEREMIGSQKHHHQSVRKETFATCWQLSSVELWWMWKVYCQTERAVAIRTTYRRLDECLPQAYEQGPAAFSLLMGKVQYGPYASLGYTTPLGQRLGLAMSKQDWFQDEREIRVLFDYHASGHDTSGEYVRNVDIGRLVTSIVVSPVAEEAFRDEVESRVLAAGYQIPVEHSPIRNQPRPVLE
jgi:hypothetical protein